MRFECIAVRAPKPTNRSLTSTRSARISRKNSWISLEGSEFVFSFVVRLAPGGIRIGLLRRIVEQRKAADGRAVQRNNRHRASRYDAGRHRGAFESRSRHSRYSAEP